MTLVPFLSGPATVSTKKQRTRALLQITVQPEEIKTEIPILRAQTASVGYWQFSRIATIKNMRQDFNETIEQKLLEA